MVESSVASDDWDGLAGAQRAEICAAILDALAGGPNTPIGVANAIGSHYRGHWVRPALRAMERRGLVRVTGAVRWHDHELPIYALRPLT